MRDFFSMLWFTIIMALAFFLGYLGNWIDARTQSLPCKQVSHVAEFMTGDDMTMVERIPDRPLVEGA